MGAKASGRQAAAPERVAEADGDQSPRAGVIAADSREDRRSAKPRRNL